MTSDWSDRRRVTDPMEPPVDLAPLAGLRLDAARDSTRWAALVTRIEMAAESELTRRAVRTRGGGNAVVPFVARTVWPAALAAAATFLIALGVGRESEAARTGDVVAIELVSEARMARALGIDEPGADWIAEEQAPTSDALAQAIGLGGEQP